MKSVVNTSPIIWLDEIGDVDLITRIYDQTYTTPSTKKELSNFDLSYRAKEVIGRLIIPERILAEKKEFNKIVRRRQRRLKFRDTPDIEVLVAFQLFSDADEMLFANKNAERRFSRYGEVRDVARLFESAEQRGIFNREDSIRYLQKLLRVNYRNRYVRKLLDSISI